MAGSVRASGSRWAAMSTAPSPTASSPAQTTTGVHGPGQVNATPTPVSAAADASMMPARTTMPRGSRASNSLIPHPATPPPRTAIRTATPVCTSERSHAGPADRVRCPHAVPSRAGCHTGSTHTGSAHTGSGRSVFEPASNPARIACTGAGTPVISSNWRKAWCSNMSRPVSVILPGTPMAASGVGHGW